MNKDKTKDVKDIDKKLIKIMKNPKKNKLINHARKKEKKN